VYKQSAGNIYYLHGDRETIQHVHEQAGPPKESIRKKMDAQAVGRDTYEVALSEETTKEYAAGTAPVGTTAEEWWEYWCDKLGYETECTLSPPTGDGRTLQAVLSLGESVDEHEWRLEEEGEGIAEQLEEKSGVNWTTFLTRTAFGLSFRRRIMGRDLRFGLGRPAGRSVTGTMPMRT
jgi:hypothetical protein